MGNEMGNNNTSAIKEEDNISEVEKNTISQDASELANGISQDVDAESGKEENQHILTSIDKDVMEKDEEASDDATTEPGKDTRQEDSHADDVNGKIQTVSTAESKDVQENGTCFASKNTASMHSLEGDTHASDMSMENQMHPTSEAEHVQEKTVLASDCSAIEHGKVTLQDDIYADDVKEKLHMVPSAEDKDVQKEATGLISNNTATQLENDLLERYSNASDENMENQMHPEDEDEAVREKPTGLASEYYTISSLEKDLLERDAHADDADVDQEKCQISEGKDDQEIPSKLGFHDKTSEPHENKHDADVVIPKANGTDVEEKINILASEDLLNLKDSFVGAVHDITEARQPEKSTKKVEAEGENHEILSSSSLERIDKYENQRESCLRMTTYNHHHDKELSIKELQESSSVHPDHDEPVNVLSEQSHNGSESLINDNFLDTNSHAEQIKDETSEKEMESQDKMLCTVKSTSRDRNEFGSGFKETSGVTSESPSIGNNSNDNPLKSDHEEKVLCKESTMESSYNYNLDCMEETMKEFKSGMVNAYVVTMGSNGDYNGESNTVLGSDVSWIDNTDQVEEPKVTENGFQFDACINNYKASDETSFVSEQKHSVVHEAEMVCLISVPSVVGSHEKGENYMIKMEETNGKLEASYANVETSEGKEMSEECNSDLVTINKEEYFSLQTKSFTSTSMPDSDWRKTNGTFDSSNLTVPSLDLVDDEAFEKEGEIYSQYIEATSLKGEELATSAATMSSEVRCSNNSVSASGGYETREILTRLSTESESDNTIISFKMQKSPSFNLNLRIESRPEESDQAPLLYQDKLANERMSNQASLNLINNSMPNAEYGQCMLQNEEMPVEEKTVTMEISYSEKCKAPFIGQEEEDLLVMPQTQDNHSGTNKDLKEVSSTSPKGKEKRRTRSSFFSSCMCCATVAN